MEDIIVTVNDARATTENKKLYCARGMRKWFNNTGLDFQDFLDNGIPASTLIETGDSMALAVVEYARDRVEKENNG